MYRHNVLLDKDFNGIVGDFGFALVIPKSVSGRTLISAPLIARTEGTSLLNLFLGRFPPFVMCTAVEWLVACIYILKFYISSVPLTFHLVSIRSVHWS